MINLWDFDDHEPLWREYLEKADHHIIEETGLDRKRLKQILEVLYKYRIIN